MKKKSKDRSGEGETPEAGGLPEGICVARHPRTAGAVRRAKAWGGLGGLVLTTLLALSAHNPPVEALMRGLLGGALAYIAVWALAVTVARQLVIAEVRARFADVKAAALAAQAAADRD